MPRKGEDVVSPSVLGNTAIAAIPSAAAGWGTPTIYPIGRGGNQVGLSSGNPTADRLWAIPFRVARTCVMDQLSAFLNANGGAGARGIAAIYDSLANGYPGARLATCTEMVLDAGAPVQVNAAIGPVALNAGTVYWLCPTFNTNGATTNMHQLVGVEMDATFVFGMSTVNGTSNFTCLRANRVYDGTCPATYPAGATRQTDIQVVFCARFSA